MKNKISDLRILYYDLKMMLVNYHIDSIEYKCTIDKMNQVQNKIREIRNTINAT